MTSFDRMIATSPWVRRRTQCAVAGHTIAIAEQLIAESTGKDGRGILPVVPCQGSVGASGDLAPFAHLALPLIGEGHVRVGGTPRPDRPPDLDGRKPRDRHEGDEHRLAVIGRVGDARTDRRAPHRAARRATSPGAAPSTRAQSWRSPNANSPIFCVTGLTVEKAQNCRGA